jgi:hypothetical protein
MQLCQTHEYNEQGVQTLTRATHDPLRDYLHSGLANQVDAGQNLLQLGDAL